MPKRICSVLLVGRDSGGHLPFLLFLLPYPCSLTCFFSCRFGPIVYRLGHQVFQPGADHPLGGILAKNMFYVYILKSTVKDVYYIGSTEDLRKRLVEHNQGKTKSIRHRVPLELKYYEAYSTRTLARKREIELKRNSFKKKEVLARIEP